MRAMISLFYQGFSDLQHLLILAPFAYFSLVIVLRLGGKRTLSKMNAFDFIVTVAMGSILATTLLSEKTSLSEGVVATVLLVGLQYLVTFTASRSPGFCKTIKSTPSLLCYNGQIFEDERKRERITHSELLKAMREAGYNHWSQVGAIILENDGSLSVLPQHDKSPYEALGNLKNAPRATQGAEF